MSSAQNGDTGSHAEADLAQAFKELQRGEQTAAALEAHLDSIEKKIEALLAQAEKAEKELKDGKADDKQSPKADEKTS
ncbi:hypothetical protein COCC4DRAFT_136614 [Bipolaris maydis ATCC 48331]|uniref:Uncharacterized protein n=2 Tax=Cochliobolus heterostrophus TaxID=5016 RepID=M2USZ1_COCH5|nr:uncharacterized protein COCC4DRAFT_136614 [Bipolaris maydis ATCC 48331]EMD90992.1 hypothetical protein COCHEDRAFT_1214389 [Bipolaris maydis C5]KAH7560120.1 hypothetical protein BM1_03754 [Bipolaris maydis]ENI05924.1 hypothetical protein COCC4DRAFT_136614 [Bipolaris maydis ATCC 48331]KAJ5022719.1 hypothetical protein J3E73DRAFT_374010 [Bipolaris maydis]KAJ5064607.1 hypothetical protein J3E74DRAFT_403044 [Bipolaris maydis]